MFSTVIAVVLVWLVIIQLYAFVLLMRTGFVLSSVQVVVLGMPILFRSDVNTVL